MNKKEWLDKLYYEIGKQMFDFRIFGSKKMPDGSAKVGKWHKYSEMCFGLQPWEDWRLSWINNREQLPNEVVLDYDEPEFNIDEKIKEIKKLNVNFYAFFSGSRGYHIHLFFKTKLNDDEKIVIIKRFGGELQKIGKSSIALEFADHWKTGKPKTLYYDGYENEMGVANQWK